MDRITVNGDTYLKQDNTWYYLHKSGNRLKVTDTDSCSKLDMLLQLDTQLQPIKRALKNFLK